MTGRLAPGTAGAIADLVRGMNWYSSNLIASNLIEGYDTRPVDIERALRADLAAEPEQRDLQTPRFWNGPSYSAKCLAAM